MRDLVSCNGMINYFKTFDDIKNHFKFVCAFDNAKFDVSKYAFCDE